MKVGELVNKLMNGIANGEIDPEHFVYISGDALYDVSDIRIDDEGDVVIY